MGLSSKRLKIAGIFMAFLETRANLRSNRAGFNVTRPTLAKLWPFQFLKKKRKKIVQFEILMGFKGLIKSKKTRIHLINPLVYNFVMHFVSNTARKAHFWNFHAFAHKIILLHNPLTIMEHICPRFTIHHVNWCIF